MKIIDMHCDTIYEIHEAGKRGERISLRENNLMLDLQRMKKGGYLVQNFALFVERKEGVSSFSQVKELLSVFKREMADNRDWITEVATTEEIRKNEREEKLSALLTVEEGGVCEGKTENLHYLYEQGVRMMTLTWNFSNEIGFPNVSEGKDFYTPNTVDGLTDTGIELVKEMERLGMIIDVSHLSDAGFYDVAHNTKAPFVASHSNARAVCPWVRNLTDEMIKTLAGRGGVAGLNYCSDFLRDCGNGKPYNGKGGRLATGTGFAGLEDVARHARHIADTGGIECLGLGSDFDGIPAYPGMPEADKLSLLADELVKQGFHESEIDKIFYQNVLRLYREILG
ncbi:MAG: dipeptidase [Bacteroidales bacterium]|nr:dipeptidase [Clostridium sp.]MCM1204803.1 dipeptidase [Bacteroidales bacterium]